MIEVPAIRLKKSPDLRPALQNAWGNPTFLENMLANPNPGTICIPIEGTSASREFTIECWLKPDGPRTRDINEDGPIHISYHVGADPLDRSVITPAISRVSYQEWCYFRIDFNYRSSSDCFVSTTIWERYFKRDSRASGLRNWGDHRSLPKITGIVIGSWKWTAFMIAELRVWDRTFRSEQPSRFDRFKDRRLDGGERGLIGYWKFNEGKGEELLDLSRSGTPGKLCGGEWVEASGLSLDCALEELQRLRDAVKEKKSDSKSTSSKVARLVQDNILLPEKIRAVENQLVTLEQTTQEEIDAVDNRLIKIEEDFNKWGSEIEAGGKVALDTFCDDVAVEIDNASRQLDEEQSPYGLQNIDLKVKMLPVQLKDENDFRIVFPPLDDHSIHPEQLGSLELSFETRPREPVRALDTVPDVRGYTELLSLIHI